MSLPSHRFLNVLSQCYIACTSKIFHICAFSVSNVRILISKYEMLCQVVGGKCNTDVVTAHHEWKYEV